MQVRHLATSSRTTAARGTRNPLPLRVTFPHTGPGEVGITLGGISVSVGIVLMVVWSFWIGLIIALVGLVAFGGFARGRWY
jgi:hypothetical protein